MLAQFTGADKAENHSTLYIYILSVSQHCRWHRCDEHIYSTSCCSKPFSLLWNTEDISKNVSVVQWKWQWWTKYTNQVLEYNVPSSTTFFIPVLYSVHTKKCVTFNFNVLFIFDLTLDVTKWCTVLGYLRKHFYSTILCRSKVWDQ